MALVGHPRVLVQILQPNQARLGGHYTLVVSEHPGFGSDPPIGSNREGGVTKVTRVYFDHVIVLPIEDVSVAPYRCKDVLDFFT